MLTCNSFPSVALPPVTKCSFPKFSMASKFHRASHSIGVEKIRKPFSHTEKVDIESRLTMPPEKVEIFKSMEGWAKDNILSLLKSPQKSWQPQDFLPDAASNGFMEQVNELRERASHIPDDYFVVLVGDMITEEALPSYQTRLSSLDVFKDDTGIDNTRWAIWTRAWTAEENRHGDLLNKYLYLSGRVDMKQIETTIQHLIGSGMDIGVGTNPYLAIIYTSFQERATFVSHGNTAKLAIKYGDSKLAQICGTIASDEKRHETAYTKIIGKLFELDPNETMMAFSDMMRKSISMPAHLMNDGYDENLFLHFTSVASRIGVYTSMDYINILEHLIAKWNVEKLLGLSSEGQRAQDYVCELAPRLKRLAERAQREVMETSTIPFSWIFESCSELPCSIIIYPALQMNT